MCSVLSYTINFARLYNMQVHVCIISDSPRTFVRSYEVIGFESTLVVWRMKCIRRHMLTHITHVSIEKLQIPAVHYSLHETPRVHAHAHARTVLHRKL